MNLTTVVLGILFLSSSFAHEQLLESNFNESEYAHVEDVYLDSSDSIHYLVDFIDEQILPKLPFRNTFLDIGAGPGNIAKEISCHFASTTVIDPNQAYLQHYNAYGFISHVANFQDVELTDAYDLVLCSHVLYHIEQDQWVAALKKLHQCIANEGRGIVIYCAPRSSWHDLCLSINPEYFTSQEIKHILHEERIPFEVIANRGACHIPNRDDFSQVVSLFAIDDCFSPEQFQILPEQEKMRVYALLDTFIEKCKRPDGSYSFYWDEDIIILKKE